MITKATNIKVVEPKIRKVKKAPYEKTSNYKQYKKADIKNHELYQFFVEKYGPLVTYNEYCYIITEYNIELGKKIIGGNKMLLYPRLSKLYVREKKRNHRLDSNGNYLQKVDWGTTDKLNIIQENGKKKRIFYTNQPYWYQIYWEHTNCIIPNKTVYKFNACQTLKNALSIKLNHNALVHLTYRANTKPRGRTQDNLNISDNSKTT